MDYDNTLETLYHSLYSFTPRNIEDRLQNPNLAQKILSFMGKIQPLKYVHIAGTNGKGSVALKIASGLSKSGFKVGLFTSPHIFSFRERISINDEWVSKEDFANYVSESCRIAKQNNLSPHFFELLLSAALKYFSDQKVDFAVIEAGVGGRLDTTNFITPELSVITSIGLDHTNYLGDTLEKIAYHKAGIIKEKVPVVIGSSAQLTVVKDEANALNAPKIFGIVSGGYYDDENTEIAALSLKELSKNYPQITDEKICLMSKARPRCRFEVYTRFDARRKGIEHFPEFCVFDVAHNAGGLDALLQAVTLKLPAKPLIYIVALSVFHDCETFLRHLVKSAKHIVLASHSNPRLEFPKALASMLEKIGYKDYSYYEEEKTSYQHAVSKASEEDSHLVVCGSFYIMHSALNHIGFLEGEEQDPPHLHKVYT